MSKDNKSEEFLSKTKDKVDQVIKNVDTEKIKQFESKFSIKQLKRFVQILLVGAVVSLGVFSYWNYDHNMGDPTKVKFTNKDQRDVKNRTLKRWGN
ncbi:hypothetical protein [Pseudogracilibacillus sp. SO10305]|uniref:hypothetical protein n=1 Tax=Pseudogracilibacillus sp. SO10305 TaxID=3098292 RepID=UPI00300E0687